MSIYSFRGGPQYRAVQRGEQFLEAIDQPLSIGGTLADQFVGGMLESYGLGTAVKDATIPQGDVDTSPRWSDVSLPGVIYNTGRRLRSMAQPESPSLSEEDYKQSPYYRERIPWDRAMTEDRAAALAIMDDRRSVREYYSQKRPISSFFGNLAGQAMDPINYIPIAGPGIRAAAIAKAGRYGGRAVVAAGDAAANTALFGLATADERGRYGDDVSWEALTSEIASAALIGSVFGTVSGAFSAGADAKVNNALLKLKEVQESRAALNDAVAAVSRGEDVEITPAVQNYIRAFHGSPHNFDKFDVGRIGTGEGQAGFGSGLYFADRIDAARDYQARIAAMKGMRSTIGGRPINWDDPLEVASFEATRHPSREAAADFVEERFNNQNAARILRSHEQLLDVELPGNLYEVDIRADDDRIVDLDARLSDQPEALQKIAREADLSASKPGNRSRRLIEMWRSGESDEATGQTLHAAVTNFGDDVARSSAFSKDMKDAGFVGLTYTEKGANEGRNYVVFDDSIIDIVKKNGVDFSLAKPEPIPEGRNAAEKAIGRPDDYRALTEQYRVEPETGSFNEEADIAQLETEGRLTEADQQILAEAQNDLDDGAAYGEALKAAVGCIA